MPDETDLDVENIDDVPEIDTDTSDTPPEEDTPPSREELEALKKKLKAANNEAAKFRIEAKNAATRGESETETAVRTAREEAQTETENKWKPLFIKQAAKAALADSGVLISTDRAMTLLDLSDVDVDPDDGTISGLTEAIRQAKKENPDFFGKRNAAQINAGDKDDRHPRAPKTTAEKHAAKLLGR